MNSGGNMLDNITFGEFITKKRKQAQLTLKDFAKALSLSSTYICNVEKGKKPAPAYNIQIKMAEVLKLDNRDRALLFDLATKTKQRVTVPQDILEYIKDDDVCSFLRTAINMNYEGKDLLLMLENK